MPMIRGIIGPRHSRVPVKNPALRKFAKRAGTVVLVLVALDLIATTATLALGWHVLKR